MMKSLISIILCIALCLSISVFSSAEQETDLSAFETVGETVLFGHYEQDNILSNGKEPIEWIVLDVQDGKSMLLSKYILDAVPFNSNNDDNIWSTSSLRAWLNKEFIECAFTEHEAKAISLTKVDNSPKQHYEYRNGSENTEDNVFLLSCSELNDFFDIPQAACRATAFAKPKIAVEVTNRVQDDDWSANLMEQEYSPYWLRSPGGKWNSIQGVHFRPRDTWYGAKYWDCARQSSNGVRPAMWVCLDMLRIELKHQQTQNDRVSAPIDSPLFWGQEYTNGEFTYCFVQEGELSYYSLRGKDSDSLVNAVTSNAIPGTEKINQKIQEIMQACNYEATEGELDGVRTELYGSQESDAYVMATYGDWGVNMMLFVDGTTGIADYFSGTITTEDDAKSSSKGSLFGSAMQKAGQDTSKTRQFSLTAKEYIDAFNKQYGNMGMYLVPDSSHDDCHLAIRGEPTDIRIQFCDKINGPCVKNFSHI